MIEGAVCLALWNIFLTAFSLSPTHFESISGPFTGMKFAFDSVAMALASSVLPVPGGPSITLKDERNALFTASF